MFPPRFFAITALAAVFTSPALADVTAEDVWQNALAPLRALGAEVTAATTRDDAKLLVGDVLVDFPLPFESGNASFTTNGGTLTENGDGTVTLAYPDLIEMDFLVEADGQTMLSARVEMDGAGWDTRASGDPGDVTYTYESGAMTMRLTDLFIQDEPDMAMTMTGTGEGFSGQYRITEGDLVTMEGTGTAGDMVFDAVVTMAGADQVVSRAHQETSVGETAFRIAIPNGKVGIMNLSSALRDGLMFDVATDGGSILSETIAMAGDDIEIRQVYDYQIENLAYRLDDNGLDAKGTYRDLNFDFTPGPDLPIALAGAMDRATGLLRVPLNEGDSPAEAAFLTEMEGLTLADEVWALFDPAGQLPRDPATLKIDLTGQIKVLQDLLDIAGYETMTAAPVELHALTLNGLTLDMAGARVDGTGAFTFDNSDLQTFGGIPAPDGSVELQAEGLNGLLDGLEAAGLAGEDEIAGMRMMLGLFAKPGAGDDVLTSTIAVKPDGQVLANGQRLR